MSNKSNGIFSKPLLFSVAVLLVILIGSIITAFYPLVRSDMHPVLDGQKQYSPIELAGRDIYQKEGCSVCHSQTVRPLRSEVLRYGDYTKAGESAYEHPFLWGSRRTGPDLARIGYKYNEEWHRQHFLNPQQFAAKSNMPKYYWFETNKINPKSIEAHMKGLGYPYTQEEIDALEGVTELEAITAYMLSVGIAVEPFHLVTMTEENFVKYGNPMKGKPEALARGRAIFMSECAGCHGTEGQGNVGMSLQGYGETMGDAFTFTVISNGYQGLMPGYINTMTMDQVASVMEFVRSIPAADKGE